MVVFEAVVVSILPNAVSKSSKNGGVVVGTAFQMFPKVVGQRYKVS
jgi:hypothetical protein